MTIIEEMREHARQIREVSSYDYGFEADQIRDWADRLERSGALVPVPDGESLSADAAEGTYNFVMHDGEVLFPEPYLWNWMRADGSHPKFHDPRTPVQPVRLVPLAEAEL